MRMGTRETQTRETQTRETQTREAQTREAQTRETRRGHGGRRPARRVHAYGAATYARRNDFQSPQRFTAMYNRRNGSQPR